jgi:hypothetical protein
MCLSSDGFQLTLDCLTGSPGLARVACPCACGLLNLMMHRGHGDDVSDRKQPGRRVGLRFPSCCFISCFIGSSFHRCFPGSSKVKAVGSSLSLPPKAWWRPCLRTGVTRDQPTVFGGPVCGFMPCLFSRKVPRGCVVSRLLSARAVPGRSAWCVKCEMPLTFRLPERWLCVYLNGFGPSSGR